MISNILVGIMVVLTFGALIFCFRMENGKDDAKPAHEDEKKE